MINHSFRALQNLKTYKIRISIYIFGPKGILILCMYVNVNYFIVSGWSLELETYIPYINKSVTCSRKNRYSLLRSRDKILHLRYPRKSINLHSYCIYKNDYWLIQCKEIDICRKDKRLFDHSKRQAGSAASSIKEISIRQSSMLFSHLRHK